MLKKIAVAALFLTCTAVAEAQTARPSKLFDSAALLKDLQALSSEEMNGRAVGSADGAKARAFLAGRLKAAGLAPIGATFEQPFTFTSGGRNGAAPVERRGVNLVGQIKGTRQPARYIVLTAHYDHLAPRNGVVMNGADDNASGAAALVAVTEYFAKHRPANSLIVVACDGEEAGLQGAKAFVAAPPVPAASIVVNVNLDMIGRDPDDKLFAVGTLLNPVLKPIVEQVAKTAPVKLLIGHDDPANKALDDWTRDSDHFAFWDAWKLPFIYLGVEDESQHHKATDDYETMSHDFYVRAVETAVQLLQAFDKDLDVIAKVRTLPAPAFPQGISFAPAIAAAVTEAAQTAAPPPAFVYSDGYRIRAKVHKISSLTMLPLLATQGLLGQSIYTTPTQTKRDWHSRVAWGIGGLFAVNTVTGTMNLIEARKDPTGRKLRIAHAVLMLAADAGFLATAAMAPETENGRVEGNRSAHRAIAFTSIGTASLGYLLMLFGHK